MTDTRPPGLIFTSFSSAALNAQPISPWCPVSLLTGDEIVNLHVNDLAAALNGTLVPSWVYASLLRSCTNLAGVLNASNSFVLGVERSSQSSAVCVALDPCAGDGFFGFDDTQPLSLASSVLSSVVPPSVGLKYHTLRQMPITRIFWDFSVGAYQSFNPGQISQVNLNVSSGVVTGAVSTSAGTLSDVGNSLNVLLGSGSPLTPLALLIEYSSSVPNIVLGANRIISYLSSQYSGQSDLFLTFSNSSGAKFQMTLDNPMPLSSVFSAFGSDLHTAYSSLITSTAPLSSLSAQVYVFADDNYAAVYLNISGQGLSAVAPSYVVPPPSMFPNSVGLVFAVSMHNGYNWSQVVIDNVGYCPTSYVLVPLSPPSINCVANSYVGVNDGICYTACSIGWIPW